MALTGAPRLSFRSPMYVSSAIRFRPLGPYPCTLCLATDSLTYSSPSQRIAICREPSTRQDLSDKADLVYRRLCAEPIENLEEILESAQQDLPSTDIRSIVECFSEDDIRLMKSIRVLQWARKQKYFQTYEDEEKVFYLQKGQVEMILMVFLRSMSLSTGLSERVMKRSGTFITHLQSILSTRYFLHYTKGESLTMQEIEDILIPYLKSLAARHQDGLINILVDFPDPPMLSNMQQVKGVSSIINSPVKRDGGGNCGLTVNGNFRPSVSYALSLGLSLQQVQIVANRCPNFLFYNPERKMKRIVNYFLALGVTKQVILKILVKRPQVFGCDLEDNLKPTMLYLESIGVDRSQWPPMLERYPMIFTCGRDRIEQLVRFLHSVGFSSLDVKRALCRHPHLVSYDIKQKFEPLQIFLGSIGVTDAGALLRNHPPVLGYSIDGNLKPTISFLVEIGYSKTDVIASIQRYPEMLGLAINTDLKPKWDYYLWTGWPKSNLLTFPQYFGYNLDKTIKPRFEKVLRDGVCWSLGRILSSSDVEFERLLRLEKASS